MADEFESEWIALARPPADYDGGFRAGAWQHLTGPAHIVKHGVVAGYLHKLVGRGSILDAGCGEGVLCDYLDVSRFEYVAFDNSHTAVERARASVKTGTFYSCDLDKFRPPPGTAFAAVIFNESLQESRNPFATLDRYRTFLTAKGVIIVSLFENPNVTANGPLLIRLLTSACSAGRYNLLERADAVSITHSFTWRFFVLR